MPKQSISDKIQRVLIVGNDTSSCSVAERALQNGGLVTMICRLNDIASHLVQFCPDLILLDSCLSGEGELLLKMIRSFNGGGAIPVMIAAEEPEKEQLARYMEDGAADIVISPYEPDWLVFRVKQMLIFHHEITAHKESREHLEAAQRVASLGHWEWYPETGLFRGSEGIAKILGLEHGHHSTTLENFLLVVLPEERNLVRKGLWGAWLDSCEFSLECRIIAGSNIQRVIRLQGHAEKGIGARRRRLTGIMQDLTSMRQMEDRLEMLKEAVDSLPIGITLSDINGRIVYSNPTEARMHGYEVTELIGREANRFGQKRLRKPITPEELHEIGVWRRETINIRKNGDEFPVQLTSIAVKTAERCLGIVTTCEDISDRKDAEKQIYHLAYLDSLTGLPNRRMFQDRLSQALALARREEGKVCLAYLDIDNFKDVNDSKGHDFGDKLLQRVSFRLSTIMRESDTLARLGGDEFVVILVSVKGQDNFTTAAQRMLNVFSQPFEIDGQLIYSSISIGIAIFPDDGHDSDMLLKCADTAMYQAKKEGKSDFRFFSAEMNERIMRRVAMESALHSGLANSEFFLQYQPQWDMTSNRITGAEALLRWQSKDFGLMQPVEFITLIEDCGLIFSIGEWVLRTACLQANTWASAGYRDLKIAVNISGKQLKQPDFLEVAARALRESGVNPERIEFEFTESVIMEEAEKTIEILRELKKMGLLLSIDDFGTGYSSLNYLKNFPIDRIKIDRSFVVDLSSSSDDAAIVQAIISLAGVLRLKVIAEGIETKEQLDCLKKLGCHEMQGYLFGKPMSADELADALMQTR